MTGDPATVLVVDDNETIADTYAAFLDDEYAIRTAYGGESALDLLDSSVDVVLLDRRMPKLSGDEVLSEIERRRFDCRVVMVTAVEPAFDIVDMPFDEYVVKPVEREDIVSAVEEMLRRSAYDDEFRRFLALASKKATLETEKSAAELAASDDYDRIERRLAEKRERLGIDPDQLTGVFASGSSDVLEPDESRPTAGE